MSIDAFLKNLKEGARPGLPVGITAAFPGITDLVRMNVNFIYKLVVNSSYWYLINHI